MKLVHYIANILILLGAAALIGGVFYKVFIVTWWGLSPSSFLRFGDTCLLLGIALYVREVIPKKKEE
jgi:hypothetical protein